MTVAPDPERIESSAAARMRVSSVIRPPSIGTLKPHARKHDGYATRSGVRIAVTAPGGHVAYEITHRYGRPTRCRTREDLDEISVHHPGVGRIELCRVRIAAKMDRHEWGRDLLDDAR
jgi:hypothetical protein